MTPFLASAGLVVACFLILAERTGKAVRSPAKSALLAQAASGVGLGRGFAVHKALDQLGAVAGPLLVAAVLAATGLIWPAMALLALPGAAAIVILLWIRHRGLEAPGGAGPGDGEVHDPSPTVAPRSAGHEAGSGFAALPAPFWLFALSSGATTAGLVTFGVISYHLTRDQVVPVPVVPVVYAAAMGPPPSLRWRPAGSTTGSRVASCSRCHCSSSPSPLSRSPTRPRSPSFGVLLWGAAIGVQDSTVKALVADLVQAPRRATAYGVFAAVQGATAIAGGLMAGVLYERSIPALIAAVAVTQAIALGLLAGQPARQSRLKSAHVCR